MLVGPWEPCGVRRSSACSDHGHVFVLSCVQCRRVSERGSKAFVVGRSRVQCRLTEVVHRIDWSRKRPVVPRTWKTILAEALPWDGVGLCGCPPSTVMQEYPCPHQEKHVSYQLQFESCRGKEEDQRAIEQLPSRNLGVSTVWGSCLNGVTPVPWNP